MGPFAFGARSFSRKATYASTAFPAVVAGIGVGSGVAVAMAVVVGLFMRDDPRQVGLQAYGAGLEPESAFSPPRAALSANPFKLALQTLGEGR